MFSSITYIMNLFLGHHLVNYIKVHHGSQMFLALQFSWYNHDFKPLSWLFFAPKASTHLSSDQNPQRHSILSCLDKNVSWFLDYDNPHYIE